MSTLFHPLHPLLYTHYNNAQRRYIRYSSIIIRFSITSAPNQRTNPHHPNPHGYILHCSSGLSHQLDALYSQRRRCAGRECCSLSPAPRVAGGRPVHVCLCRNGGWHGRGHVLGTRLVRLPACALVCVISVCRRGYRIGKAGCRYSTLCGWSIRFVEEVKFWLF